MQLLKMLSLVRYTIGKQKHLRYKKVAWPRKTAAKRGDMRVWPRLTMHLR